MIKILLAALLMSQLIHANQIECFWFYQGQEHFKMSDWSDIFRLIVKKQPEDQDRKSALKRIDDRVKENARWVESTLPIFDFSHIKYFMDGGSFTHSQIPPSVSIWLEKQWQRASFSTTIANEIDRGTQLEKMRGWMRTDQWITKKALTDRTKAKTSKLKLFDDVEMALLIAIHEQVIRESGHRFQQPKPHPLVMFTPFGFFKNAMKKNADAEYENLIAGKIRDYPVRVRGKPGAVAKEYIHENEVEAAIDQAFRWLKKDSSDLHPLERIFTFYRMMVSIHPFADGNGRSLRMLCDYLLMRNGYPPIINPGLVAVFPNHESSEFPSSRNAFIDFLNNYYNYSVQ